MAIYLYEHPDTKEVKEVFQKMNDEHKYFEGEVEWRRVYTVPTASVDNKIDPFSSRDFVEKTGRKRDNYGSLLDRAKDAHLARVAKEGRDIVKEKWLNTYETTNNTKFFDSSKDKVVKKNGVTIDFGAK